MRCALPGFPTAKWRDGFVPRHHMGHSRLPNNPEPKESHDEGCPGSFYRSPFVLSLIPYLRNLTEGGFSENIRLTRCTDRLVLDAVALYERHQLDARRFFAEQRTRTK